MSAGQNVGPLDREGRCLFQPPLPPDEATWALAAAAGISTVGLRPSFVIPAAAHSHPDCRAILILIVAPHKSVADAIRAIGVTEVTYYRWRQEYGGLRSDQVKRMKDLEAENTRLRRAVSDLTLDKMILAEAARGNY